jgi:hypothetical protein
MVEILNGAGGSKVKPGEVKVEYPVTRVTDLEEVRKLFKARPEFKNIEEDLIQMIAESGAILKGHFILNEDGEQG